MYPRERNAAAKDATVTKRRARLTSGKPEKSSVFPSHRGPRGTRATTKRKTASAQAACAGRSGGRDHTPKPSESVSESARLGEEGAIRWEPAERRISLREGKCLGRASPGRRPCGAAYTV